MKLHRHYALSKNESVLHGFHTVTNSLPKLCPTPAVGFPKVTDAVETGTAFRESKVGILNTVHSPSHTEAAPEKRRSWSEAQWANSELDASAKGIDSCQSAQSAQADMNRYLLLCVNFPHGRGPFRLRISYK